MSKQRKPRKRKEPEMTPEHLEAMAEMHKAVKELAVHVGKCKTEGCELLTWKSDWCMNHKRRSMSKCI